MIQKLRLLTLIAMSALMLQGCAGSAASAPETTPAPTTSQQLNWPKGKLTLNEDGVPMLDVYVVEDEQIENIDIETYVQGVLAGEMKNDWPLEALKAQAILARTFVLKFVDEKESTYPGADISTDIEEAQAYAPADINARIRQAVSDTRGLVLSHDGSLPYAWFHAHSGGLTELAKPGLSWDGDEPGYTLSVQSSEPESVSDPADNQALKDAQTWSASFPYKEFEAACAKQGVELHLKDDSEIVIAERGESGRAVVLEAAGHPLNAAELRIALGSTKMRSTLLTSLKTEDGSVHMQGKGYGHGVGMSQWGAYGMAQNGASAKEIVTHYFQNVTLEKLW
ncbi:MAG: SpoIID/LytB domain-containing protein [Clostridia bacterium]|nr:SpoIID/LytB domain-containing protein [Clostridia bacterium]